MTIFPEKIKVGLKIHYTHGMGRPEFISGSDIQCVEILKQVQDD